MKGACKKGSHTLPQQRRRGMCVRIKGPDDEKRHSQAFPALTSALKAAPLSRKAAPLSRKRSCIMIRIEKRSIFIARASSCRLTLKCVWFSWCDRPNLNRRESSCSLFCMCVRTTFLVTHKDASRADGAKGLGEMVGYCR